MKRINYSMIRTVCALIIGFVLVLWPDLASDYLIITIGVLFMLPGLIGIIGHFTRKKGSAGRFPIEAVGSFLFGLWLVIMPGFFSDLLVRLFGVILIVGGGQQLYSISLARRWTTVPLGFYILPSLILLSGLFIVFDPVGVRNMAFFIIGIACLVYAISELVNWFRFANRKPRAGMRGEIEDATIIEE